MPVGGYGRVPCLPGTAARLPLSDVWFVSCMAVAFYLMTCVAGSVLSIESVSFVGGMVALGIIAASNPDFLFRTGCHHAVLIPLVVLALSGVKVLVDSTYFNLAAFCKSASLCFLYLFGLCTYPVPVFRTPWRRALLGTVCAYLGLSLCLSVRALVTGARVKGVFVNANDFACMSLAPILLIDEERDRGIFKVLIHAFTCACILVSGTAGAALSYVTGMGIKFWLSSKEMHAWVQYLLVVAMVVGVLVVFLSDLPFVTRVTNGLHLAWDEGSLALSGQDVNLYQLSQSYDEASTSSIWRLRHWRRAYDVFAAGSVAEKMLGFGPGATPQLLGKKAHNDYVRIMLEHGILGMALVGCFMIRLLRRTPRSYVYALSIPCLFAMTENVVDNLPYMFILVFFISSLEGAAGVARCTLPNKRECRPVEKNLTSPGVYRR